MNFSFKSLAVIALCLAGAAAQAQVSITLNVTAVGTNLGYVSGTNYTFIFTTGASFANNPESIFSPTANLWRQLTPAADKLFSSITGSGVSGTFNPPVVASPNFQIITDTNYFYITASAQGNSLGISVNGGADPVVGMELQRTQSGVSFPALGTYAQPNSILAAMTGSYATPGPATYNYFAINTATDFVGFELDSFEIGAPAAEVPFGVDSTVGLALLGGAAAWKLRRRRRVA